jgi:hypothetical protein
MSQIAFPVLGNQCDKIAAIERIIPFGHAMRFDSIFIFEFIQFHRLLSYQIEFFGFGVYTEFFEVEHGICQFEFESGARGTESARV